MIESPQRRSGGREGRRLARLNAVVENVPFLTRALAPYEVLSEEGLALLEWNADTILEEVGIDFRGDAAARETLRLGGADVDGERVRFPRGMCRSIIQASAPRVFTQHARNPERNVQIGDPHMVFAPNYGSPFVRDLDGGRRYGTIEDFRNFVKLTYMSPHLHHSGGTICEPVDLPVNKRHFDMVYSHMRWSDKPFMGSVTHPDRARDSVAMARILFGEAFVDEHAVMLSLVNANSPLVWDATMVGSARAYAEANQGVLVTPFMLAGAMAPVTTAAATAQTLAEAMAGMTFVQLVRPGAPVVFGSFASSLSMQSGAPTFGTPEPNLLAVRGRAAGAPAGGAVPLRRQPLRVQDPGRAGRLRIGEHVPGHGPRGHQLRAARRGLDGGRAHHRLREVHHGRRPVRHGRGLREGRRPLRERAGDGRDPHATSPGSTSSAIRTRSPTSRPRSTARRSPTTTATSSGSRAARSRRRSARTRSGSGCCASTRRRRSIPPSTRRCIAYMAKRKAEFPDSDV